MQSRRPRDDMGQSEKSPHVAWHGTADQRSRRRKSRERGKGTALSYTQGHRHRKHLKNRAWSTRKCHVEELPSEQLGHISRIKYCSKKEGCEVCITKTPTQSGKVNNEPTNRRTQGRQRRRKTANSEGSSTVNTAQYCL